MKKSSSSAAKYRRGVPRPARFLARRWKRRPDLEARFDTSRFMFINIVAREYFPERQRALNSGNCVDTADL